MCSLVFCSVPFVSFIKPELSSILPSFKGNTDTLLVLLTKSHVKNSFGSPTCKYAQMKPNQSNIMMETQPNKIFVRCFEWRSSHCPGPSLTGRSCNTVCSLLQRLLFLSLPLCTSGICTLPCFCALCVLSKVSIKLLSVFLPNPPSHCCRPWFRL